MDYIMYDEIVRLYPGNVSSDFEDTVRGEIIEWILSTPSAETSGKNLKDVIEMFWSERLN